MYGIRDILLEYERRDYYESLPPDDHALDCSMGTNPYGPWPGLTCPDGLLRDIGAYPPDDGATKAAICRYYRHLAPLDPSNVVLACGSFGAMLALNRMVLCKGKTVLGIAPQFTAVVDDFAAYEASYVPVYLKQEHHYAFSLSDFLSAMEQHPGAYIYIDNPNNPTGQVIPRDAMGSIVSRARELDSFVAVDEAYGDYMPDDDSAIPLVERYDNLAVVRSFSKGFGAAGIRLGYIIAQSHIASAASKVNVLNAKTAFAAHVAQSLLQSSWPRQCAAKVAEDKATVLAGLRNIKVAHTHPHVAISLLYTEDERVDLRAVLLRAGIRTVPGAGYGGIGSNTVRLNLHANAAELARRLQTADQLLDKE